MLTIVLGLAAVLTDGLVRWGLTAATLAGAPLLYQKLVRLRVGPRLARTAPLIVLAATFIVMMWPLLRGDPPVTRDHGIHYVQTRILVDEMLPTGRFSGWTDRINHGFPYGESYPTLGYLWVSLAHLLSFGHVDLRTSYAWGLASIWALMLWGVWHLAAALYGEHCPRAPGSQASASAREATARGAARWAGCLASLAWLADPGASREGGWIYLMFHGVWPQLFSTALWIASIVWTLRALKLPTPRKIAWAGLLLAASLQAHPFGLITAAASATIGLLIACLAPATDRARDVGSKRVLLLVYTAGILLAIGGLATFFVATHEMDRRPVGWSELGDIAARFVMGDLFAGPYAWAAPFAVIGFALTIARGKRFGWFVVALLCGLMVLASQASITVVGLDLLVASVKNVQFPRFAIAIKPLIFALSGMAMVVVIRAVVADVSQRSVGARLRHYRVAVAILLAPACATALAQCQRFAPRPIAAIDTLQSSGHAKDDQGLCRALAREHQRNEHMRVAFLRVGMGGGTYPLFCLADSGANIILDGHIPTINFDQSIDHITPAILQRLGATHILYDRKLDRRHADLPAHLERVGRYGPYTLARLDLAPAPFVSWTSGKGDARVEHLGPQSLAFELTSPGPGALTIPWAPSDRWQWTVNGAPVASESFQLARGTELLRLPVPHSGLGQLSYHVSLTEQVCYWISLVVLCLAAIALTRSRQLQFPPWPLPLGFKRLGYWFAGIAIGSLIIAAQHRHTRQLAANWATLSSRGLARNKLGQLHFTQDLSLADAIHVRRGIENVCSNILTKDVRADCQEPDHAPHLSMMYIGDAIHRCTAFSIAPHDTAYVSLGSEQTQVLAFLAARGNLRAAHVRYWQENRASELNNRAYIQFDPRSDTGNPTTTHQLRIDNRANTMVRLCVGAARFE